MDAGLQCLHRAVVDAPGDAALQAGALVTLGSALIHAVRGRDEEAAVALHEALVVGMRPDLASSSAAASRALGYVELLRGRYDRAQRWLERAAELAGDDGAEGPRRLPTPPGPRTYTIAPLSLDASSRARRRAASSRSYSVLANGPTCSSDITANKPS